VVLSPMQQQEHGGHVVVEEVPVLVADAHHHDGAKGEIQEQQLAADSVDENNENTSSALVVEQQQNDPLSTTPLIINNSKRPWYILPLIVASQFAGTSLWFAGNAVLDDLVEDWTTSSPDGIEISESARGYLTSMVQFGFIVGTLVSAVLNLADSTLLRPTRFFWSCTMVGAILNAVIPFWKSWTGLLLLRFGTGLALAGIYPVGMKIAADWYPSGDLGLALGWLIGALCVGSALPFLLQQIPQSWQALLWETSGLAALGGLAVGLLVPDGPFRKLGTNQLDPSVIWTLFDDWPFRGAALGFFGHMWEVYAFWTWCPVVWKAYLEKQNMDETWDENAITFGVIAIGGLGCALGGCCSVKYGSARVAFATLATSGLLCLLSPLLFLAPPAVMLMAYLLWGMVVVADSPQFSSLVATTAPDTSTGSALMIVNCIGYIITIASIQLMDVPLSVQYIFLLLAPGPLVGCWAMRGHVFPSSTTRSTHQS
jgi:predicted MFS family arabinose efflux permease